jgi:hypothetical protein
MAERTESQGFYEMLWDCDHCGTKGLLAKSQRHCAECGAKQNPDKRYFPQEGQAQQVVGHAYEGADRGCPACRAPQSARAHNCTNCGAPLDGAREVRAFGSTGPAAPRPQPAKKRRLGVWLVVLGLVGLGGFGVWYRFLRTSSAVLTVTAHRWERVIPIEEFRDFAQESWRNEMPSDARLASCYAKKRSTKQVADGEECHNEKQDRKDGTFEVVKKCQTKYRDQAVTDDWCTYRLQRWKEVPEAALRAAGVGLSPSSPAGAPSTSATAAIGARRAGALRETLTLELGKQRCAVSESTWKKHADGEKAKVKVLASTNEVVCGSL